MSEEAGHYCNRFCPPGCHDGFIDSAPLTNEQDRRADDYWGLDGWVHHDCPDGKSSRHSVHYHHNARLCGPTEKGWECRV